MIRLSIEELVQAAEIEEGNFFASAVIQLSGYIAALEAENGELLKDANRYRHMRASFARDIKHRLVWYLPILTPRTADGLDSAIDAAIAAKGPNRDRLQ